jgi:hypothetical protein
MMNALDLVTALVHRWVAFYTLGLPRDVRTARCNELESDLWEQRQWAAVTDEPHMHTAGMIAGRAALGALSDISWRVQAGLSARSGRQTMERSLGTRLALGAIILVASVPLLWGVSRMLGAGGAGFLYGLVTVVASVPLVAGIWIGERNPQLGLRLVLAGAVAVSVVLWWMFFIVVPVALALIGFAYLRTKGGSGPRRTAA